MSTPAHGLLIAGMHRSGTSALARVLNLCGADIGARLLDASAGNERGHWEDAFAVELHERLLANFGIRWSDPFSLPPDWLEHEATQAARRSIVSYLRNDRSRHPLWAVKDPRISLFADLWIDAAAEVGMPLSTIMLVRHPMEVARSLETRDGIPPGRAFLLWMDYTVSALKASLRVPSVVLSHDQFLADWRAARRRIDELPGTGHLKSDAAVEREIAAFLDIDLRHHAVESDEGLPGPVAGLWRLLQASLPAAALPKDKVALALEREQDVRTLIQPLLMEYRAEHAALWQRVASAEELLSPAIDPLRRLPGTIQALGDEMAVNRQALVEAISVELRRMQEVTATAVISAEQRAAQAESWRVLHAGLLLETDGLRSGLDSARAEAEGLRSSLDTARAEAIGLQSGLDTARAEAIGLQSGLDTASAEARRLRSSFDTALAEAGGLRSSLETARTEAIGLRSSLDTLRAEFADLQSALDGSKRENSGLRAENVRLRHYADQFEQIRASHSWRLTRPLRVLRRMLSGNWAASDSGHVSRDIRGMAVRLPFLPAAVKSRLLRADASNPHDRIVLSHAQVSAVPLAMQEEGVADVFVWSVIDWHFRTQRPQHLARALAGKKHRVFYMSNNFVDDAEPGFSLSPLDGDGRLFQVHLHLADTPSIYAGMPDDTRVTAMRASLAQLLTWSNTRSSLSIVQHPYWVQMARSVPNARLVYDCMDHHQGFENNATSILRAEEALIKDADLVVVTSSWLEEEMREKAQQVALIRNATDYDFFQSPPARKFRDAGGRRIIGYYGAIAEWFDVELVREVALACPQALVVLVGADTSAARDRLADLKNVHFTGEVPYRELPYWLHAFDVCILPFQVLPLTLATNPVKVYEYLSAGKPVVAVDLPEMAQFSGLVDVAGTTDDFVSLVRQNLAQNHDPGAVADRQAFAAGQTWAHRAAALDMAVGAIVEPCVSLVVLTYNNLEFTRACLFSVEAHSDYPRLEIIVVDNASTDGSPEWLREWEASPSPDGHRRKLILNDENTGFAGGNNIGLRAATGEFLVLLNNDTYVTPGWVRTLCAHFRRDPLLGLIGPVTNNIGNEAKLDISYTNMEQMIALASGHTRAHPGSEVGLATAAFFCVAMPRTVFETIGELDEAYGLGFFEDDDYCRRVERAGLRIACAEDVFVHHHLSASFDKMSSATKRALFEQNKKTYEEKWGAWTPHAYRPAKASQ